MKISEAIKKIFIHEAGDEILADAQGGTLMPLTSPQVQCPSFEEEPWKSLADKYRPPQFNESNIIKLGGYNLPPLRSGHRYLRLYLRFLDTLPKECWIDEENEQD